MLGGAILLTKTVYSVEESQNLAKLIGQGLEGNMIILLEGELGAGKTTFSKGIGSGLGITKVMKSPTYTIIREYQEGRLPLYHMDLYRLEDSGDFDLGLEEYFDSQGVCLVEWSNLFKEEMPNTHLKVQIKKGESEYERHITLIPIGQRYQKLIDVLENI